MLCQLIKVVTIRVVVGQPPLLLLKTKLNFVQSLMEIYIYIYIYDNNIYRCFFISLVCKFVGKYKTRYLIKRKHLIFFK